MAIIISGKKLAAEIQEELKIEAGILRESGCVPSLTVVLVGEDPASQIYVRAKTNAAERLGIRSQTIRLPVDTTEKELLEVLDRLNNDPALHGILVQLPLPTQIDPLRVTYSVSLDKDVDGFHPVNRGKLVAGEKSFVPCTPLAVQQMLLRSGFDPDGQHVVIVGRSMIVGTPLASMLTQKAPGANATVTVCHTGTRHLADLTRQADILIAAVGRPEAIKGNMVKDGVVVIDVGVNRVEDTSEKGYKLVGDVAFDEIAEKAKAISPVPGGVGPMTITMLLKNTIFAAKNLSRQ